MWTALCPGIGCWPVAAALIPQAPSSEDGVPRVDDPAADGWQSESLAQVVGSELKKLAMILEHPAELGPERLAALVAHEFVGGPLRPQRLRRVFADDALLVLRQAEDSAEEPRATSRVSRGPEGFAISLAGLLAPLRQASDIHAKFEVVGVEPSGDRVATRQILSLSGHTPSGTVEIHSTWESAWQIRGDGTIRLTSLTASDYEETTLEAAGEGTLFSDCTEAVLAGNSSFEQQILQGPSYWLGRLEAALGTDIMGHSGLAVGDVNGDGLDDLYVPQHGGLPNRLYVQTRDGTATDRSAWAGVDWLDRSLGTLLVDLDNDGDQDLVVGTSPALLLMANDGRGRFSLRATRREARYAYSLAAADYDNDGDLDIYATRYSPIRDDPVEESVNVPKPIPYYDAENGAPNVLLRNDGDWRFTDATVESGLDADNRRWSFVCSVCMTAKVPCTWSPAYSVTADSRTRQSRKSTTSDGGWNCGTDPASRRSNAASYAVIVPSTRRSNWTGPCWACGPSACWPRLSCQRRAFRRTDSAWLARCMQFARQCANTSRLRIPGKISRHSCPPRCSTTTCEPRPRQVATTLARTRKTSHPANP